MSRWIPLVLFLALATAPTARAQDPGSSGPSEPLVPGPNPFLEEASVEGEQSPSGRDEQSLAGAHGLTAPEVPEPPPTRTLADQRLGDARDGHSEHVHVSAEVAVYSGRRRQGPTDDDQAYGTVVATSIALRLAMAEAADTSIEWTLAGARARVNGLYVDEGFSVIHDRVEPTNPVVRVGGTLTFAPWISLRIWGGAAFPVGALAALPLGPANSAEAAYAQAVRFVHESLLGMFAGLDPWRFFPERLSFPLSARLSAGEDIGGALEVAGAVTVPVLGSPRGEGAEGVFQVAGDFGATVIPELRLGLRASIAVFRIGHRDASMLEYEPRVQPAIEPWVRLRLLEDGFVTARFTFNILGDQGLGTAQPTWAAHLGGGFSL